jgi:hypothetical protein
MPTAAAMALKVLISKNETSMIVASKLPNNPATAANNAMKNTLRNPRNFANYPNILWHRESVFIVIKFKGI